MNYPIRLIPFFLIVAVIFSLAQASAEPFQLRSIQADFTQEKHMKILARPIISTGKFTFQTPNSLRWEYTAPIRSLLLMHGSDIQKYIERDGQLVEDRGLRLDSMQVVLAEIGNWLNGNFTDNSMFQVSRADKTMILLTPKEKALAGLISKIELHLADQQGLLDEIIFFEGPDSFTRFSFTNRVLNKDIPAATFTTK